MDSPVPQGLREARTQAQQVRRRTGALLRLPYVVFLVSLFRSVQKWRAQCPAHSLPSFLKRLSPFRCRLINAGISEWQVEPGGQYCPPCLAKCPIPMLPAFFICSWPMSSAQVESVCHKIRPPSMSALTSPRLVVVSAMKTILVFAVLIAFAFQPLMCFVLDS